MRGRHGNHARADQAGRWSDDRKIIASTGYVKIRVGQGHPLADPNGYAYEHLVVWCAAGRERPALGFLLHHRNEVKTDNRLDNLELISRSDHNRHHAPPRDPITGRLVGKKAAGAPLDGKHHKEFPCPRPI